MSSPSTDIDDHANCGPGVRRPIVDAAGLPWDVWRCVPSSMSKGLTATFAAGWLTFESPSGEKRRFAPAPPNWRSMPDSALTALLAQARRARPTTRGGA